MGLNDIREITHPWLDAHLAPLFVARFPPQCTNQELTAFMEVQVALVTALRGPYAWVIDVGPISEMTATQRKIIADYEKKLEHIDKQYLAASGIVAKSSLIRGVITAIYWLKPPVYPYQVFSTSAEATEWARSRLQARGVKVP